jgi:citrate/tricarballylate utilization protein
MLDVPPRIVPDAMAEARRQVEICNACRYCEGYCSVFPAINRQRAFADGDITQLANLCHNCRGCYYACQYTEPHEFALNLPAALAEVRQDSWERFIKPAGLARLFQESGVALAAALVAGAGAAVRGARRAAARVGRGVLCLSVPCRDGGDLCARVPGAAGGDRGALRDYWREVGGARVTLADLQAAVVSAGRMKNLDGGQGQGCNFEKEDRFSNARRHAHQATLYGFLLCFGATSAGTVMHYGLGWEAPYGLFSLPKLLGIPGGSCCALGTAGLAALKLKADPELGAKRVWGGEMGFVLLLFFVSLTGLVLYAVTGTALVPALLAVHLGAVLAFFLLMPYSKMVHGFFRMAARWRRWRGTRSGCRAGAWSRAGRNGPICDKSRPPSGRRARKRTRQGRRVAFTPLALTARAAFHWKAARRAQRRDHGVRLRHQRHVLQRVVDAGAVPVGVHRRTGILRDHHDIALVGAGAGGVLDTHVGPGAGLDDQIAALGLQDRLEAGALPGGHPHLLDHMIARLRLQPRHGLPAPCAAHQRVVVHHALEQWRVESHAGRAGVDEVVDMDHRHAKRAAAVGEAADVGDGPLLGAVLGRARGRKGAALHHHVVLHVLDDQRRAGGIQPQTRRCPWARRVGRIRGRP